MRYSRVKDGMAALHSVWFSAVSEAASLPLDLMSFYVTSTFKKLRVWSRAGF